MLNTLKMLTKVTLPYTYLFENIKTIILTVLKFSKLSLGGKSQLEKASVKKFNHEKKFLILKLNSSAFEATFLLLFLSISGQ
jgi:hypothetical protein